MKKRLTIEINGTRTKNRGGELMTIAITQRMRETFPGVRVVVPNDFGGFEERGRYGLWTSWDFLGRRAKCLVWAIKYSAPWIHDLLGVCSPEEVDVVLDANGFGFSDQWGAGQATSLLKQMNRPERREQLLIFLPQAFGPFEKTDVAKETRALFERSALVCARDRRSYEACAKLGGAPNLKQFPDFTSEVRADKNTETGLPEGYVAIVPNVRMLDKTAKAGAYIAFINRTVEELQQRGMEAVYVLHDSGEDREVVRQLKYKLTTFSHPDPRVLKSALRQASFVVGSRYHALVSALTQGVPCLGAGWSHKYPELFDDFNSKEFLLNDLEDEPALLRMLDQLCDESRRLEQSEKVNEAAGKMRVQVDQMWETVISAINAHVNPST